MLCASLEKAQSIIYKSRTLHNLRCDILRNFQSTLISRVNVHCTIRFAKIRVSCITAKQRV